MEWGKPAMWLSNTDPRNDMSQEDTDWMEGNCTFVYIDQPIFHANTE